MNSAPGERPTEPRNALGRKEWTEEEDAIILAGVLRGNTVLKTLSLTSAGSLGDFEREEIGMKHLPSSEPPASPSPPPRPPAPSPQPGLPPTPPVPPLAPSLLQPPPLPSTLTAFGSSPTEPNGYS